MILNISLNFKCGIKVSLMGINEVNSHQLKEWCQNNDVMIAFCCMIIFVGAVVAQSDCKRDGCGFNTHFHEFIIELVISIVMISY